MLRLTSATLLLLTPIVSEAAGDVDKATETSTQEVKLRTLTLILPTSWKSMRSSSSMRLGTYQIPPSKKGGKPAELTVYHFGGGGGGVNDNLLRWISQFDSKGRKVRLTRGTAGDDDYYVAEVSGTYNMPVGPPVLRRTKPAPDSRMLAVILVLEKGVYYLKLTGEDELVAQQSESLRTAFGGSKDSEKKYEL